MQPAPMSHKFNYEALPNASHTSARIRYCNIGKHTWKQDSVSIPSSTKHQQGGFNPHATRTNVSQVQLWSITRCLTHKCAYKAKGWQYNYKIADTCCQVINVPECITMLDGMTIKTTTLQITWMPNRLHALLVNVKYDNDYELIHIRITTLRRIKQICITSLSNNGNSHKENISPLCSEERQPLWHNKIKIINTFENTCQ